MNDKYYKKNLWFFPMGTIGRDAVYCLINSYLLTFVLYTHTLTAAQLTAITGIMIAARIFDALNDPIMGNIIERTRSKYGKFKPWLLSGGVSTAVVIYLMFNWNMEGWAFVWFFGIMYFAYSITYTMSDISYWGMIPALSSDSNARNQYTSRATLFAGIGSTLAAILIPLFTTGSSAIGGSAVIAYGRIALVIALLCPIFISFTLVGAHERRDEVAAERESFSFKGVFTTIARNDQLVWIAIIFLVQQIGNGLVIGGIGSTYIYFVFGYSGGLYSLFTTVGMSATAVLMVFYPMISRKIQRKKLMGVMAIIAIIGYAMMLIAGFIPGAGMVKFGGIVIGYMLSNFGQYCYYLIMMISVMNTVEYNEYKFGTRDEAIISSLRPFITKMGSALIVAITSITYIIFGVTNYTNEISVFEQQCTEGIITEEVKISSIETLLQGVSSSQINGLLLIMTILPCAMMLLSYSMYKKKYLLDEEEYDRICREIEAKKVSNL